MSQLTHWIERIKKNRSSAGWLLAILFISGAFLMFGKVLAGTHLFPQSFIGLYHYIYFTAMQFFTNSLHALPNWWPAYDSGYPINLTLDAFINPLFLLALKFLPPFLANNLVILLFLILNGFGMYLFTRALSLGRTASIIAALSYGFSGVIIRFLDVTGIASLLPFIPFSFLCCLKIIKGNNRWLWIWLGILLYSWIGGWAEITVYSLTAIFFFLLYLLWKNYKTQKLNYRQPLLFLGIIALSVFLLLPWFLSVIHFISFTERSGGVSTSGATSMPTTLSQIILMLHPRLTIFYGELLPIIHIENTMAFLYVGTLPLLLIFTSFFIRNKNKTGEISFFLWLAISALILTLPHSPLFWLFHHIPVLKWFGYQWKWSYIIVFSLAILAGYGFDHIQDFFNRSSSKKILVMFWICFTLALAGSGLTAIFDQTLKTRITDYGLAHYARTEERIFTRSIEYYDHIIKRMAETLVDGFSLKNNWVILMAGLWGSALMIFSLRHGNYITTSTWNILAIFVTFSGSALVWTNFLNGTPVTFLTTKPETAHYLHTINPYQSTQLPIDTAKAQIVTPYRIFHYLPDQYVAEISQRYNIELTEKDARWPFLKEMMDDNTHIFFNFDTFYNHQTLALQRLTNLYFLVRQQKMFSRDSYKDITPFNQYLINFSTDQNWKRMGMLNIQYVLTPFELPDRQPIFTTHVTDKNVPIYIYDNPYFMPRWYFAKNIQWAASDTKQTLSDLEKITNFQNTTLLESNNPIDTTITTTIDPRDTFEIQLYTAGTLKVKTHTQGYRFFIFSESRFPSWQAFINGSPAPLYTANYLFQAVLVPPGEHEIEFKYPGLFEEGILSFQFFYKKLTQKLSSL